VETPRKFITAVINLRGVSTNKTIIYFIAMQTYKELNVFFIQFSLYLLHRTTKNANIFHRKPGKVFMIYSDFIYTKLKKYFSIKYITSAMHAQYDPPGFSGSGLSHRHSRIILVYFTL
jgi:hypothetical protein